VQALERRLRAARASLLAGCPSAPDAPPRRACFVTFRSVRASTLACQARLSSSGTEWRLSPAPAPTDVFWENAGRLSFAERLAAKTVAGASVYALVVLSMIPAIGVGFLSSLSTYLPELFDSAEQTLSQSAFEGILPPLLTIAVSLLPPLVFRAVAVQRGEWTLPAFDHFVLRTCFLYNAFSVFIANTLANSFFQALTDLIDKPSSVLNCLGFTVPGASRFFITFVLLKAFSQPLSHLSCAPRYVRYLLETRYHSARKAPHRLAECWAPQRMNLGSELADTQLIIMLTVIFSTINPLVLPAGCVYFAVRVLALKSAIVYRHESRFEGHAQVWPAFRARCGAILLLYQATLAGVFGLKLAPFQAAVLLLLAMPATVLALVRVARRDDPHLPGSRAAPLLSLVEEGEAGREAAEAAACEYVPDVLQGLENE
jgi:hypothetical protein